MKTMFALLIMFLFLTGFSGKEINLDQPVFDLKLKKRITLADALPVLKKNRIILIGEHHNMMSHHRAQLNVIKAFHETGANISIGLEMFRNDSQDALDRWVSGNISEDEFQKIDDENWNFSWDLYGMIFKYARDKEIPMVGLNISRDITREVARNGFQSLTDDERGMLPNIVCRVDEEYMNYIREAYGAHGHGEMKFTYFCEAQLVWDNTMAINALDYLNANRNSTIIILTGVGHARKGAIPSQLRKRTMLPYTVILPEVPGNLDTRTITTEDADYLLLDL
jgi:uncharacterized iron-regulated protein